MALSKTVTSFPKIQPCRRLYLDYIGGWYETQAQQKRPAKCSEHLTGQATNENRKRSRLDYITSFC